MSASMTTKRYVKYDLKENKRELFALKGEHDIEWCKKMMNNVVNSTKNK